MTTGSKIIFKNYNEAMQYHMDHEELLVGEPDYKRVINVVTTCRYCGRTFWGSHTSEYCHDCRKYAVRDSRKKYAAERNEEKRKLKEAQGPTIQRVKWDEMNLDNKALQACMESDSIKARKASINEWNERNCCPLFNGYNQSVACFYCMRGVNYGAPAETVSNRRCPNNPIATDGSRYIQRAAYRKNTAGLGIIEEGKRYDVLDSMSEQFKVQLVERMRKLGRTFYIWSNGHVDITTDPDSNS